jgi:RNA polymerase sigma factor (TIGR02999 family)
MEEAAGFTEDEQAGEPAALRRHRTREYASDGIISSRDRIRRFSLSVMSDVTRLIEEAKAGDPQAAADLLPLVYDELRKLAAARLAAEKSGQTLQATSLVHEAYLRLVGPAPGKGWNGRGHFFAAAAEAMRRILVENARRKKRLKRGGDRQRVDLDTDPADRRTRDDDLLALDEALDRFAAVNPRAAELVKLRYFARFSGKEVAELLGVSPRKADEMWAYAKVWLLDFISENPP